MRTPIFGSAAAAVPFSLRAALVAGAAIGITLPAVAFAQAAKPESSEAQPAKDDPADSASSGNEIVVTATKREQTLQDVPVSVSVTTAETIERAQIRDIKDLASVVPSLRVAEHQSSAQTDFNIRGFGNGANNAGIEPSVGVFIDGVYRSRSAAQIADFPDVSRVEVLRGPQSTLFGKNASAGVISIVTAAPKFHTSGDNEVSYGKYNSLVIKSLLTGPLTDTLAYSIASGFNRRDGYVKDAATGRNINDRKRGFVRGQLLYVPSTQLKVRLIADYGTITEYCCAVINVKSAAPTAAVQALGGKINNPATPFGDVFNNFDSLNQIKNYGVSGQIDYTVGPLTLTSITAWRKNDNVTNQDSDFTSLDILGGNFADVRIRTFTQEFRAATNLDGPLNFLAGAYFFDEKINQTGKLYYGSQARIYANALNGGTLGTTDKLVQLEGLFGALQGNPAKYLGSFFATGTGINEAYTLKDQSFSVFGQVDFKIAPRLTLTGGINYTHDKKNFTTADTTTDVFSAIPLSAFANPANNFDPVRSVLLAQGVNTALGGPVGGLATPAQIGFLAGANPAAFAFISSQALAGAQNIAGLKALQFLPPFLNVPNANETGRTSDGNVSYTARLAYQASSQVNLYLSYATGFKASSINLSRDSRPAVPSSIDLVNQSYGSRFASPEKSTVYEAGLKANWGIASVNVAVFKESIKGFQSNLFTGTGFVLGNAGKESVFGFEFEGMIHPFPELTLSQALTYLKPKYDSYIQSPFGDVSGSDVASVPPISLTSAISWDHRLANADHLIVRGDWHYESSTQIEDGLPGFIVRNPLTGAVVNNQPGIDIGRQFNRTVSEFDASMTYAMHNGFEFSVWGRNLSDNRYFTVVFDTPLQTGAVSAYPNQPRTYGMSARYKF